MTVERKTDEELMTRFQNGSLEAFEVLYQRYRAPIFSFLVRQCVHPDSAEELAQDVFMKVIRSASSFGHASKFSTWIFTIARNQAVDAFRKGKHRNHASLDQPTRDDGPTMKDRLAVEGTGEVASYVHMGGKIGVLLGAKCSSAEAKQAAEFKKLLEDSAMQVAAMAPQYLSSGDIPEAVRSKQSEIFDAQLTEEGKPEKVRPGIIQGKLRKWSEEVCLLEQKSVIETDKSVGALVQAVAQQLKADIQLSGFVRYQLGEGIDKPVKEDFASEVARMSQGS